MAAQFVITPMILGGSGTPTQNGFSITLAAGATVNQVSMTFAFPAGSNQYMLMTSYGPANSRLGGWTQNTPLLSDGTQKTFALLAGQTLYVVPGYITPPNIPNNNWYYYNPVAVTSVPPANGIQNTITCNPKNAGDSAQLTISLPNAGGGL